MVDNIDRGDKFKTSISKTQSVIEQARQKRVEKGPRNNIDEPSSKTLNHLPSQYE